MSYWGVLVSIWMNQQWWLNCTERRGSPRLLLRSPDQTNHQRRSLSSSLSLYYLPSLLSGLFLYLSLSVSSMFSSFWGSFSFHFLPLSPPTCTFIPLPRFYLIATCHSQSALFRYPEFPVSQAAGRREIKRKREDDERRNDPWFIRS